MGQTYLNLDIVLINDGSTDGCGCICENYAANDNRIRVFHRKNSGLVASRTFGLSVAMGKYLIFIDSDDYIVPDMCEQMLRTAVYDNCDVVWCDVSVVMKNEIHITSIKYTFCANEMIRRILRGEVPGWMTNKLIRRSFYNSADIQLFPADCMFEDILQSIELLCANPKMGYVNFPLYYYNRTNELAMTAGKRNDVVIRGLNNIKHIYDYLVRKNLFEVYRSDFACVAMKAKFALLHEKGVWAAQKAFPFAHSYLAAYKMQYPAKLIYWFGFNGGLLGTWLMRFYMKIWKWRKG